jgi:hypothetical protein
MKTHRSLLLLTVLLFAVAASAQTAGSSSESAQSSAQTGSSSGTSGSMASQAGSQAASGSDTEQMMEGCIIKEQQDYYLEPINGQEVHLNGPDVAQHVNHHVRIHGNEQPTQSSSTGSTGTMAGSSSSGSSSAANPPEFLVTRVDMVSESCPANLKHRNSSGSQGPGSGNTHGDDAGPKQSSF